MSLPSNMVQKLVMKCLPQKNVACHISKQRMLQPSSHHITAALTIRLEGTRIETGCQLSISQPLQPPPTVHREEPCHEKAQDTGPK